MSAKAEATAGLLIDWRDGDCVECVHCKLRGTVGMRGRVVYIDYPWPAQVRVCEATNGGHLWGAW